jgi:hypothetical protein
MGRVRDELAADLRSFPFGRYVIFYEPIEDGIDVVRVLHGARDIDAVFGEDVGGAVPALAEGCSSESPARILSSAATARVKIADVEFRISAMKELSSVAR